MPLGGYKGAEKNWGGVQTFIFNLQPLTIANANGGLLLPSTSLMQLFQDSSMPMCKLALPTGNNQQILVVAALLQNRHRRQGFLAVSRLYI